MYRYKNEIGAVTKFSRILYYPSETQRLASLLIGTEEHQRKCSTANAIIEDQYSSLKLPLSYGKGSRKFQFDISNGILTPFPGSSKSLRSLPLQLFIAANFRHKHGFHTSTVTSESAKNGDDGTGKSDEDKPKSIMKKRDESDKKIDSTTVVPPVATSSGRISAISRREKTLERNFITPTRAMNDFLLNPTDLVGLRKTLRRSPHPNEHPITVFWRKDIVAKCTEVWVSLELMREEKLKRETQRDADPETEWRFTNIPSMFNIKRVMKKYNKETRKEAEEKLAVKESLSKPGFSRIDKEESLFEGSGRIVLAAVTINGTNFMIKFMAWWMTGSHSLFAESIHSLADTINQCILAYGIHKSTQRANTDHPYGYANMKYVASLISGVGIFCVGAGLSFYHGITGLMVLAPVESLYWAFYVLAGSLVSEGATLFLAVSAVRKRAKDLKVSFREFVLRGHDPSLNVVILEDTAAVSGVIIAAICMGTTMYSGNPIPDAVGSLVIGGLLGGVASFIVYSNSSALVGRSIPRTQLDVINAGLEQDVMIRAIHDVKGIDMGNTLVRYKAEVDFDGRELTKAYLEKQDMGELKKEISVIKSQEDIENFILKHGENIVDTLGAEIDRIENRLKNDHPEIRHCDLEIL